MNFLSSIPFEVFRNGLPHGRFRVIVNPALAPAFVAYRVHAASLALALYDHLVGALLVGAGVLLRWSVKKRAPQLLLHMATRIASVYEQATEHGVMEVRRA